MNQAIHVEAAQKGYDCPHCGGFVKIYERSLDSGMAYTLILIYKRARQEWTYLPDILDGKALKNREWSKLRWWGLLDEDPERRTADGNRSGFWRVTDDGAAFVNRKLSVQQKVREFHSEPLEFTGPYVYIDKALGKKFNYRELMQNG